MESVKKSDMPSQHSTPHSSSHSNPGTEKIDDTLVARMKHFPFAVYLWCKRKYEARLPSDHRPGYLQQLPAEIQAMIWNLVVQNIPPRVIPIYQRRIMSRTHQRKFTTLYSPANIPAALQVLGGERVWRALGLRDYEWSFGLVGLDEDAFQSQILVGWDRDILYLPEYSVLALLQNGLEIAKQSSHRAMVLGVDKIKTIALSFPEWSGKSSSFDMNKWTSLERILLVYPHRDLGKDPVFIPSGLVRDRIDPAHGFNNLVRHNGVHVTIEYGILRMNEEEAGAQSVRNKFKEALLRELCLLTGFIFTFFIFAKKMGN